MTNFCKLNKLIASFLTVMLLSTLMYVNTYAATTTSSSTIKYFNFKNDQISLPQKTKFMSWTNQNLISTHTPHHNGYDVVYNTDDTQYVEGDFQYGDFRKALEKEWISIYEYSLDDSSPSWKKLGRTLTDSEGHIKFAIPDTMKLNVGLHLIKLYVEGDGTQANMYIQVLTGTKKYVVFDMDGTLTTTDFESVKQYSSEFFNSNYVAKMYTDANNVAKYYSSKGYDILYLTARPYWLSPESQKWLIEENFPMGLLHTNSGNDLLLGDSAADFKANYLKQLKNKGIQFCYGYGNASSDVEAYSSVGIDKNNIFTIGQDAGVDNSIAISSYTNHLKQLSAN